MIQVNLLPPEHRVKDRAPVSRLIGLVAALLVTFLAMGAYLYTKMFLVNRVQDKFRQTTEQKALDMARAKVYDDLDREVKAYKTREEKIDEIAKTDPKYAPLLHYATKMAWDGEQDDQLGFKAWYSAMSVALVRSSGRSRAKGEVAELRVKAATATDDVSRVGNYYRAIKAHDYFRGYFDLETLNPIKVTRQEHGQYEPSAAMDFEVKVQALPADELLKKQADAAKAAAGGATPPGGSKAPPGDGKAPPGDGKAPGDGKKG